MDDIFDTISQKGVRVPASDLKALVSSEIVRVAKDIFADSKDVRISLYDRPRVGNLTDKTGVTKMDKVKVAAELIALAKQIRQADEAPESANFMQKISMLRTQLTSLSSKKSQTLDRLGWVAFRPASTTVEQLVDQLLVISANG